MKYLSALLLSLFLLSTLSAECRTQRRSRRKAPTGYVVANRIVDARGDTLLHVQAQPIVIHTRGIDLRRWNRLVTAVKRVYPVAQLAKAKMQEMEAELASLPTRQAQRQYIQGIYDQIKEEYTPILKKMTRSQGRVLIKLIDRETDYTAYEVLREFRGGFIAGFWQTIGKIFGHDLKDDYDPEGEDKMIEQIVRYYEAGLL